MGDDVLQHQVHVLHRDVRRIEEAVGQAVERAHVGQIDEVEPVRALQGVEVRHRPPVGREALLLERAQEGGVKRVHHDDRRGPMGVHPPDQARERGQVRPAGMPPGNRVEAQGGELRAQRDGEMPAALRRRAQPALEQRPVGVKPGVVAAVQDARLHHAQRVTRRLHREIVRDLVQERLAAAPTLARGQVRLGARIRRKLRVHAGAADPRVDEDQVAAGHAGEAVRHQLREHPLVDRVAAGDSGVEPGVAGQLLQILGRRGPRPRAPEDEDVRGLRQVLDERELRAAIALDRGRHNAGPGDAVRVNGGVEPAHAADQAERADQEREHIPAVVPSGGIRRQPPVAGSHRGLDRL